MSISLADSSGWAGHDEQARLSAFGKFWKFPVESEIEPEFLAAVGGSILLAQLLKARGVLDAVEANSFLNTENYMPSSPMELPDVDKAVIRITEAIAKGERITVYGDYDVDGITGTSVLLTVLRRLGASVDFYIPNRAGEGYGLNLKAVSILASKHRTKLLISCDCGVSNFAEIQFARSLGVDTLVLDHHSMPDLLPPAVGIVHPKRLHEEHPLFHLPGVGVAYKVCEALLIDNGFPDEVADLLDYVTLGMIADLVPLVRENRYLVKIGLPRLVNSARPGIQALLAQVKKSDDTDLVGFGLAPRINAVGRLADARIAVELLTTADQELADNLARQLQTDNLRRQELCEQIFASADAMVSTRIDLEKDRAIAIFDEGWHHGVVGIVASRLVEKYHRPVFIGELDPAEGTVKGSARSIDAIDLYQVLKANEHLLAKWGGHKMAAGFTVEADKAQALCRALTDTCNRMLADKPMKASINVDLLVQGDAVTDGMAKLFMKLAPFGMWNKKPMICMKSLTCASSRLLGKDGKHHRVMLTDQASGSKFECVMWNTRGNVPADGQTVDAVFTPEINSFNGRERLQLVLADWRDSDSIVLAVAPNTVAEPAIAPAKVVDLDVVAATSFAPTGVEELNVVPIVEPMIIDAIEAVTGATTSFAPPKRDLSSSVSTKISWKDLRQHGHSEEILAKAVEKLGGNVNLFAEGDPKQAKFEFVDRLSITKKPHLIVWQFPPSAMVFQELLFKSGAQSVYLVGVKDEQDDADPGLFLRKLLGLVKYAVNKKEGQAHGEKLAAVMGSTKMSVALGLTILKKVNLIDWFSEDGYIYLDLIGAPTGNAEELPEYRQFAASIQSAKDYRDWCLSTSLKEIQLAVTPNHIDLGSQADVAALQSDDVEEIEQEDEYPSGQEQIGIKPSA